MNPPLRLARRRFLAASGLAVAPFILPSRIWSAAVKPNDRIALGFIGMGTQNRGLMNGFLRKADAVAVAVCDVDTNRRDAARQTVETHYAKTAGTSGKGCTAHPDFREVLARTDIDAVVIATPDHWHAPISIAAAAARKDIYCEKPLCQSIHEARAMVKAVRRHGRVFQTGSMQRSAREFRVACELVRNGVLGKIHRIEVGFGGPSKPCDLPEEPLEPGLDWNLWLGPAPFRPYHSALSPRGVHKHYPDWRNYREYGGGGVTDWGAHHVDIAQWGLGMDDSGPVEVLPTEVADGQSGVRCRYANGVELTHKTQNGVWFHGDKGWIYVNRGKFELWLGSEQKAAEAKNAETVAQQFLGPKATHLYVSANHLDDWLKCIRTRKRPIADVEVGARTVSVCHLMNLAYAHGQRLQWDPRRERFTGGTGNAAWLDVPHRTPWKV